MYRDSKNSENSMWMEMDLKVRKLISDLVEPSLARLRTAEAIQTKVQSSHRGLKERIRNTEAKIDSIIPKIPSIDPINKRIAEQSIRITGIELDSKSQADNMINEIEAFASKFGNLASQINSLYNQNEIIRRDIKSNSNNSTQLKGFFEEKMIEIKNEMNEPHLKQAETNILLQTQIGQLERNLEFISNEISSLDLVNKTNERKINRCIFNFKAEFSSFEAENKKILQEIEYVKHENFELMEKVNQKIKKLKNDFMDKILEMNQIIQNEQEKNIDKILDYVLIEPRYKKKLMDFKRQKSLIDKANPIETLPKVIIEEQKENNGSDGTNLS